ncbi:MAG: carotenoid oxygenase family protein [Gemmatimonadales bacterium]|nr:MAG: carotenoid oxygenase family protein [Gemmatimonadales bacterium]
MTQEPAPYEAGLRSLELETSLADLPVEGRFPDWLEGTLLRNGPARFQVGEEPYRHWFDGHAMLHAFTLEAGTVSYRNRFLRSGTHDEAMAEGRIARSEFATDPCRSIFGRVMAVFRPRVTDNANINVARLARDFVALTETPLPIRFDPESLETLGHVEWADELRGDITTAHPHVDPASGILYSYLTHFSRTSTYRLWALEPGSRSRRELASLPVDRPAYMHSFAMTGRHLVLSEFPLVVNPLEMALRDRPFIENYRWEPERGTLYQVFDRKTGEHRATCRGPACFAFHHVNAFDDPDTGEVVLDLAAWDDARIIDQLYLKRLRRASPELVAAEPRRLRLDLTAGTVRTRTLSTHRMELPRIAPGLEGRRHRYVWATGNRVPGHFTDELVKLDSDTGEVRTWHEPGCHPGEPVVVRPPASAPSGDGAGGNGSDLSGGTGSDGNGGTGSDGNGGTGSDGTGGGRGGNDRPDSRAEDAGVVLSVVLDARSESSFLLVLDAASLEERARARVPHAVPLGFHGQFFGRAGSAPRG